MRPSGDVTVAVMLTAVASGDESVAAAVTVCSTAVVHDDDGVVTVVGSPVAPRVVRPAATDCVDLQCDGYGYE